MPTDCSDMDLEKSVFQPFQPSVFVPIALKSSLSLKKDNKETGIICFQLW